ncbi:MAG: hypothetical protein ACYTEQ_22525 [Planctomycetota bacterium]|jgi:hypothetical protein
MAENWIDGLLKESETAQAEEKEKKQAEREARRRAKAARKRLAEKPAPIPFREQRWEPVAVVGLFSRRTCRLCEAVHFGPTQGENLFIRHERHHAEAYPTVAEALRKTHVPSAPDLWEVPVSDTFIPPSVYCKLPREQRIIHEQLEMCEACWEKDCSCESRTFPLPLHFFDRPALPEPDPNAEPVNLEDLFMTKEIIRCTKPK